MKMFHLCISILVIILGIGFVIDSLESWDSFSVTAAIAGWAVITAGLLHLVVALDRASNDAVLSVAVASGMGLIVLIVLGWTFASFAREWPEVSTATLLAAGTALALYRRYGERAAAR